MQPSAYRKGNPQQPDGNDNGNDSGNDDNNSDNN